MVHFKKNIRLLRNKYLLLKKVDTNFSNSESWLAVDDYEIEYLVRIWPYSGNAIPNDFQRALWDSELRTLYRVGSSPNANTQILAIRDAGIDKDYNCFVMVLKIPGFTLLSEAIKHRRDYDWISNKEVTNRKKLWQAFRNIADGIKLIHDHRIVHRNIEAESIFFNKTEGLNSFRLGGFEWSLRLGLPAAQSPPKNWSSPPEWFSRNIIAHTQETDWFSFGILLCRCLLNIEKFIDYDSIGKVERVLLTIDREPIRYLSDIEKRLLKRLIAIEPNERLSNVYEIFRAIDETVQVLDQGVTKSTENKPLILVLNPFKCGELIEYAKDMGFHLNDKDRNEAYSPHSLLHISKLKYFIQDDLKEAQIFSVQNQNYYILVGEKLSYRIDNFNYLDRKTGEEIITWDFAYLTGYRELRGSGEDSNNIEPPKNTIFLTTKKEAIEYKDPYLKWDSFIPKFGIEHQKRRDMERFYDFIRCTNQIEILLRSCEIYHYKIIKKDIHRPTGSERIIIKEIKRDYELLDFWRNETSLVDYLSKEIESGKPNCDIVSLVSETECFRSKFNNIEKYSWKVHDFLKEKGYVELLRPPQLKNQNETPDIGYLRSFGMGGQLTLIQRRSKAISKLGNHSYLLNALTRPGELYIDIGKYDLPVEIPISIVDEIKQLNMKNILRVRPIFALQGPPGTGKTTLVAHLLQQILHEDPVAQILVTAQAHGAVDVLAEKVRDVFSKSNRRKDPLAVRLGRNIENPVKIKGTVEYVAKEILSVASEKLQNSSSLTPLQKKWQFDIKKLINNTSLQQNSNNIFGDFCELVKIGSNITYCTTSAGDLEALAEGTQTFDWSIIEEAGKAHGFDVALPLNAGHRWLLIGDHKQLPPYRFEDYILGLKSLNQVVDALEKLPNSASYLLDFDWIRAWKDKDDSEVKSYSEYFIDKMNTFDYIYRTCRGVAANYGSGSADHYSEGAAAGMLEKQHRMHPDIGDIVSRCFYEDKLKNETQINESPISRVKHPLISPKGIKDTSVVWIDTPWADDNHSFSEEGTENNIRYTNSSEIEAINWFISNIKHDEDLLKEYNNGLPLSFTILSPYSQQVKKIKQAIKIASLPKYLYPKEDIKASRKNNNGGQIGYTVDSFQGNEADIVVVSLVRNNKKDTAKAEGIGFLKQVPRLNVILSRAERLLVIVGSFNFFQNQLQYVRIDDYHDPLWSWRKLLDTLYEWFETGKALRITFQSKKK